MDLLEWSPLRLSKIFTLTSKRFLCRFYKFCVGNVKTGRHWNFFALYWNVSQCQYSYKEEILSYNPNSRKSLEFGAVAQRGVLQMRACPATAGGGAGRRVASHALSCRLQSVCHRWNISSNDGRCISSIPAIVQRGNLVFTEIIRAALLPSLSSLTQPQLTTQQIYNTNNCDYDAHLVMCDVKSPLWCEGFHFSFCV